MEYFHADGELFDLCTSPVEHFLHGVAKERASALGVDEDRTLANALELLPNRLPGNVL